MEHNPLPPELRELPPPNPVTRKKHKREVLWQITVPFVVCVLLFIGLAALLAGSSIASVGHWAELSTIMLVVPLLLISVIPLVLLTALIILILQVMPQIPPYARWLQEAIRTVERYAKQGADMAAEPILQAQSISARLRAFFNND